MSLLFSFANRTVPISQGQSIIVGRSSARTEQIAGNDNLFFDNPVISRKHARLYMINDNLYIEDTGSTHGTKYNTRAGTAQVLRPHQSQLLSDRSVLHFGADVVRDTEVHKKISGTISILQGPVTPPQEKAQSKRHSYGLSSDNEEMSNDSSDSDDTSTSSSHQLLHSMTSHQTVLEDTYDSDSSISDESHDQDNHDDAELVFSQTQNVQDIIEIVEPECETVLKVSLSENLMPEEADEQPEDIVKSATFVTEHKDSSHEHLPELVADDQALRSDSSEADSQYLQTLYKEPVASTGIASTVAKQIVVDLDNGITSVVDDCASLHWDDSESACQSDSDDDWPSEYESKLVVDDDLSCEAYSLQEYDDMLQPDTEEYHSGSISCINDAFSESADVIVVGDDAPVFDDAVDAAAANLTSKTINLEDSDSEKYGATAGNTQQHECSTSVPSVDDQPEITLSNRSTKEVLLTEVDMLKDVIRQLQAAISILKDESDCRSTTAQHSRRVLTRTSRMNNLISKKLKELWSELSQGTISWPSYLALVEQIEEHFQNLLSEIGNTQEHQHHAVMSGLEDLRAKLESAVSRAVEGILSDRPAGNEHESERSDSAIVKRNAVLQEGFLEQLSSDIVEFRKQIHTLPQRLSEVLQAQKEQDQNSSTSEIDNLPGTRLDAETKSTRKRSAPDSGFDDANVAKRQVLVGTRSAWPKTVKHVALGVMLGASLTFAGLANLGAP